MKPLQIIIENELICIRYENLFANKMSYKRFTVYSNHKIGDNIKTVLANRYGIWAFNPFRHPEFWKLEGYDTSSENTVYQEMIKWSDSTINNG